LIKQSENKTLKLNAIKEYNKLNNRGGYGKNSHKEKEEENPYENIDIEKASEEELMAIINWGKRKERRYG